MESFFFGRSNHLFGIFHPCLSASVRGAIVIAPPLLAESGRAQHTLREIAIELSRTGYDVLRFDFSACGDSFGDLESLVVEDWIRDLGDASGELKNLTGRDRVSLFGVRFGAGLAAAISPSEYWDTAVLWDPILRGQDWLDECDYVKRQFNNHHLADSHEYLGEKGSEAFTDSVAGFDASTIDARRIVVIASDDKSGVDLSWEYRPIQFDPAWRGAFIENLFAHPVVSEATAIFRT